jgi:hypothetical protein
VLFPDAWLDVIHPKETTYSTFVCLFVHSNLYLRCHTLFHHVCFEMTNTQLLCYRVWQFICSEITVKGFESLHDRFKVNFLFCGQYVLRIRLSFVYNTMKQRNMLYGISILSLLTESNKDAYNCTNCVAWTLETFAVITLFSAHATPRIWSGKESKFPRTNTCIDQWL